MDKNNVLLNCTLKQRDWPHDLALPSADAMKFKGPAPEAINGRLAMAGIVWGAVSEAKTGLPIADLFRNSTPQILVFAALITYASLIPILKGARSEAFGQFCSQYPMQSRSMLLAHHAWCNAHTTNKDVMMTNDTLMDGLSIFRAGQSSSGRASG